MKDIFKRCAVLMMALAMVFSMCGCGPKPKIKVKNGSQCGDFTVSGGSLGSSGTVILNGTFPNNRNYPRDVKNQKYAYTRSGNSVTFTRKSGTSGPYQVTGTYNEKTNTFTVSNATYCIYQSFQ